MASPQTENGYTKIANEIMEAFAGIRIAGEARQCLDLIIRKTYGFNKKEDHISLSQFCLFTKMSKARICQALNKLAIMNLIITKKGNKNGNIYRLNKDFETWKPLPKKETITEKGKNHYRKRKKSLPKIGYTKEKKENIKEIGETSSPLQVENKKMNKYNENASSDSYEQIIDLDTRELTVKKPQTKKYPNALKIFNLFGKYPANWKINKTQLQAAENLYTERGIEQIIKALNFYKENKENKFCPIINSPYDLDSKWAKLISYKNKL